MGSSFDRRSFLLAAAASPFILVRTTQAEAKPRMASAVRQFAQIEKSLSGRIGVFAYDTANSSALQYRADERFPVCSTFKVLLVGGILAQSAHTTGLMQRRITYTPHDLVANSPITQKHIGGGMTVADLCAAAIEYSDNTAANLLMTLLGGPASVTDFARSLGDHKFYLNRWETELNTAIPGDLRDTSTPEAMGFSLERLILGKALGSQQREQFLEWLRGSTTGRERIRAGVPAGWQVGDKTGTGDYGTANDLAVIWPPHRAPIIAAIYTTQPQKDAKARNEIIAQAARVIVRWNRE